MPKQLQMWRMTLRQYGVALLLVGKVMTCFGLFAWPQPASASIHEGNELTEAESRQLNTLYQHVLFAYFQGDFAAALTQIAILEQTFPNGLSQLSPALWQQQIEPQLLKGSISLAFGLEDQAASVFAQQLDEYNSPAKRTLLWFLLAKAYYQQGQLDKATHAFSHISAQDGQQYLSADERDQWIYLSAQLQQQHGKPTVFAGPSSQAWQQGLSKDSIYHYYLQYNQALSLLESQQTDEALSLLEALATKSSSGVERFVEDWLSPVFTESVATSAEQADAQKQEILAIKDRANLTLGYQLLQLGRAHEAANVFARIRQQGLDGEAALLGYGWAVAKKNELQAALGIWQSLISLPHNNEYTLEAYLASAYAYEKGFAPRQSVAILQQGLQRFEQASQALGQVKQQVHQTSFMLALASTYHQNADMILQDMSSEYDWQSLQQLLLNVGVDNAFRGHLAALKESQTIKQQLATNKQRLRHYLLMLDEREKNRVERAQAMLESEIFEHLTRYKARREQLAADYAELNESQDGRKLMPQQYQAWLERLKQAQTRVAKINALKKQAGQPALKTQYSQRLQRLNGLLLWQASEAFSVNSWQTKKALQQLELSIAQAETRQQNLLETLANGADFSAQRARVADLLKRIDEQTSINAILQHNLIQDLSAQLSHAIEQQQSKIADYVLQAQLAMVRLRDQALRQAGAENNTVNLPEVGRPPQLFRPNVGEQP